jgi:hypothetical protein
MLVNRFIRTLAVNAQDDLLQFSSTGLGSAILRFIAGIYPERYPINGR